MRARKKILLSTFSLMITVTSYAFDVNPIFATTSHVYYDKEISGGSKSLIGYRMKLKAGLDQTGDYKLHIVNGGTGSRSEYLYAEGAAYGQVFNHEKEVLGLTANNKATTDSNGKRSGEANLTVKLFGSKVVDKKYRYNRELPKPKDVWIKERKFAQATFAVGPVPVTVSAGVSLEVKPRLTAKLERESDDDNILDSYIHLQAGPEADLATTASASAGVSGVLAVGVKNTLSIYDGALVADVAIYPKLAGLRAQLVHEKTGVHGKLEAFVEFLITDYKKTIATYGNSSIKRDVLLERTYGLNNIETNGDIPTEIPATLDIEAPRITRSTISSFLNTQTSTRYITVPDGINSARVVIDILGINPGDISGGSSNTSNTGYSSSFIYNSSNKLIATLTSGVVGTSKTVNLPAGEYRVSQTAYGGATFYTGTSAKFYWSFPFDETTVTYPEATPTPTPTPTVRPCSFNCTPVTPRDPRRLPN